MNQQTISAFNAFNSSLSTAVNTLRDSLQQSNSFNSMYSEQFQNIIKFQENTKAFTRFLSDQNEYHRKQYLQFKSKLTNNNNSNDHKLQPITAVSSQLSIQSTPQALNDWSYTAADRISTGSIPDYQRWRGYDPQQNNYNDYIFNEVNIERIPFKVIDTDNDSDGTNFVPSLPPSAPPSVENYANNDSKENDADAAYDICDGIEDDEKWDLYPLIKTKAFTGFFESGTSRLPTQQLEFKNDKVLKPPPTKWQEREEQNKQIINTLFQAFEQQQNNYNEVNDHGTESFIYNENVNENMNANEDHKCVDSVPVGSMSGVDSVCDDIETVAANDSAMSMGSMGSMRDFMDSDNDNEDIDTKLDEIIDDNCKNIRGIIGMKRRRSLHIISSKNVDNPCTNSSDNMTDNTNTPSSGSGSGGGSGLISNNISFIKGQQQPIKFIEYDPPKSVIIDSKNHPHYHPLIHGNSDEKELENENEETNDINGEITDNDNDNNSMNQISVRDNNGISQYCNIKQHKQLCIKNMNANDINKEIVTLRNVLDHHFNINHNDLNQVKQAIYELRDYKNNSKNKKIKKLNQEQWNKVRKKKTYDYLHK